MAVAKKQATAAVGAPGHLELDIAKTLTEKEQEILSLLYDAAKEQGAKTIIRVAGGWVRDKLLGLSNDDIDIALDDCSGAAFAEVVNAYMKERGDETHRIGVIQANPDQSKHLETARMKVCGEWVDLVNLRTETYGADSRIPEAQGFGTAEEDAHRRDFTVNALFYNVNDRCLEDLTGRGVEDLRRGVLSTPLNPLVTFRDDPLRVLRAVRFAARFAFRLDAPLAVAAAASEIREALAGKVSRERVGLELEGMLSGKSARPAVALALLLRRLRLADVVFAGPPFQTAQTEPPAPATGYNWGAALEAVRWVSRLIARGWPATAAVAATGAECSGSDGGGGDGRVDGGGGGREGDEGGGGGEEAGGSSSCVLACSGWAVTTPTEPQPGWRLEFLAAALLPLAGVTCLEKKGRPGPAAAFVVRESLKLKLKDAADIATILGNLGAWQGAAATAAPAVAAGALPDRLELGLLVRACKDLWRPCITVACAAEIVAAVGAGTGGGTAAGKAGSENSAKGAEGGTCSGGDVSADSVAKAASEAGNGAAAAAESLPVADDFTGTEEDFLPPSAAVATTAAAIVARYDALVDAVLRLGLDGVWTMKPLLDGKVLATRLGVPKGPATGKVLEEQVRWQLGHPEGDADACAAHLTAAWAALSVVGR